MDVYLEIGTKKAFAGALEWPGWCRSGRDEGSALQALFDYGPRYARVLHQVEMAFQVPADLSALRVVERLEGNKTTDFGAPNIPPNFDARPVDPAEVEWFQQLLEACWQALDTAAQAAAGKQLSLGPRGGGRQLEKVLQHVLDSDAAYLSQLGWKVERDAAADLPAQVDRTRQAILQGFASAVRGELPARGPRGGVHWSPRTFIRRHTWHVLDHAWEIEDRS